MTVETERYPVGVSSYTPMGYRVKRDSLKREIEGDAQRPVPSTAFSMWSKIARGTWRAPISSHFTKTCNILYDRAYSYYSSFAGPLASEQAFVP